MRPWKSNPIKWLEGELRLLKLSGVTPTIIEVGKDTLLAQDLRRPGVAVYEANKPVPWVFTEIDSERAVVRYALMGKPAGTRLLETRRMREAWMQHEAVKPLQRVTEFSRETKDELLNRRCANLVEALRDELLLLFDVDEKDALFAFQLGRKDGAVWVEAKLRSARRNQSAAVCLGATPTGEDFAKAEKDMLMMFGVRK